MDSAKLRPNVSEKQPRDAPISSALSPSSPTPAHAGLGAGSVPEFLGRGAFPQGQRLVKSLRSVGRQAASQKASRFVDQALEAVQVELVGLDSQDVTGRPGRQHLLWKRLAKARNVDA